MNKRSVIIRLYQNRIWFNDRISIAIGQSNLPVSEINFNKVKETFWLVEQLSFDRDINLLEVNIIDYFLRDRSSFSTQNPKAVIRQLKFANLSNTGSLKLALRYFSTEMNHLDQALEEGYQRLSLFTAEEIFDEFGKDEFGNVFSQSEEEILRQILEKAKVRNRRQLEYLAGVKQAEGSRLKFTLHPYFGFLFTVEGEKMTHFIWELLNTHATYIWSLDKHDDALARQYRRVEDAINQVRNSGRDLYKQAYHSSHIDQDLVFNVIHHEDANSPVIDGFVKWRHRLGEMMI